MFVDARGVKREGALWTSDGRSGSGAGREGTGAPARFIPLAPKTRSARLSLGTAHAYD